MATATELVFERQALPPGLEVLMEQKASDLFRVCDQEDKGFVTKRDMQRLRDELPLDPEQLENVFDALDGDHNGYLTLEEFTEGFEQFLGVTKEIKEDKESNDDVFIEEEDMSKSILAPAEDDYDQQFEALLEQLGVKGLISGNDDALRAMWENLKVNPDPDMMSAFEEVLAKLSGDLQRKSAEQECMETSIRSRNKHQEENLQQLYEEMEAQIQKERKAIQAEEERKEQKARREMEAVIGMKDVQLQTLLERQKGLQDQLETVKGQVPEIREENLHLSREKGRLEREVEQQRMAMLELQDQLDSLRLQTQSERRQRASAAFKVTENIVMEREDLVKELDLLRTLNTRMLDDKDSENTKDVLVHNGHHSLRNLPPLPLEPSYPQPEYMSLKPLSPEEEKAILMDSRGEDMRRLRKMKPLYASECECDDDLVEAQNGLHEALTSTQSFPMVNKKRRRHKASRQSSQECHTGDNISLMDELASSFPLPEPPTPMASEATDDDASSSQELGPRPRRRKNSKKGQQQQKDLNYQSTLMIYTHGAPEDSLTSFTGPASSDFSSFTPLFGTTKRNNINRQQGPHNNVPERVFKVIFVGDSNVGKSSLIGRFCRGRFNSSGAASTIGVDFQTRSVIVDQTNVCLQCWDTAGQERYRSITRQYFRKSDAVVVVYDVTNESSFLNARHWMISAKDAIEAGVPNSKQDEEEAVDQAVFILLANKLDLADDDVLRKVRKADGIKLAEQFSALFGEVSAADGRNVEQNLRHLAHLLREKQDLDIQKALKLSLQKNKKKNKTFACC